MNEPVEAPTPPNISLALTGVTDALCAQNGHTSDPSGDPTVLNHTRSLLVELPSAERRTFVEEAIGKGGTSASLMQCAIEADAGLRRWAADMERVALNDAIFAPSRLDLVRDVLVAEKRGASE
ncbi:hypothetical protein [Acetobacter sp. UBA5411]|uniref:hypothetical protein n=1 Tax=Acetobacter sp. UBA5411 TaxID=1945905 RepID=UPI0025C66E08|nr:hypothetical protein [Acetobacter sp. UBA5411]